MEFRLSCWCARESITFIWMKWDQTIYVLANIRHLTTNRRKGQHLKWITINLKRSRNTLSQQSHANEENSSNVHYLHASWMIAECRALANLVWNCVHTTCWEKEFRRKEDWAYLLPEARNLDMFSGVHWWTSTFRPTYNKDYRPSGSGTTSNVTPCHIMSK